MFITVRLVVFKTYICNFVNLMLDLSSCKPFGLLCSLLYSVLNELRCQMNKPCLNKKTKKSHLTEDLLLPLNDTVLSVLLGNLVHSFHLHLPICTAISSTTLGH